jgi:hypothetical protein
LLFADRAGSRSDEYLSLWADHAPMPMLLTAAAAHPPPPGLPGLGLEGGGGAVGAGEAGGRGGGGGGEGGAESAAAGGGGGGGGGVEGVVVGGLERVGSPVPPRTPLDCYRDMMASLKAALAPHLGNTVTEVGAVHKFNPLVSRFQTLNPET